MKLRPTPEPQKSRSPIATRASSDAPSVDRDSPAVELRLAIGRDGLGMELVRPARLACIDLIDLVVKMPGLKFPLDVSGGVARFRHRRGELSRLAIEIGARSLEKYAAPKLRGIVSAAAPEVWVSTRKAAMTVGLASRGMERAAALAFDVTLDVDGEDLRLTIARARGLGLASAPTVLAIAALKAVLGKIATREGVRFTVTGAVSMIAKATLPDAGARAPSTDAMRWSAIGAAADAWILHASDGPSAEAAEEATHAREASLLARDGDDAFAAGDADRARAAYIAALERAPRHPELAARLAEVDAHAGERAEAALATLREATRDPRAPASLVGAELLAQTGDSDAALAAFARAGETETVPSLSSRAYERAAELARDPLDALVWLDLAVARSPKSERARWARVGRRLAAGRLEEALADVEHLEALSHGPKAKHATWRRAGDAWRAAGLASEASELFERALRYVPEDPEALAGLGVALVAEGRAARGAALLARSIELAEKIGADASEATLDLARTLAEKLGDMPAAIARARAIANTSVAALGARALEGRWRAALGDRAGATLAFARLRDLADARETTDDASTRDAVAFLVEASIFERAGGDLRAAQRHLAGAIRLAPRDADVARAYRDVCGELAPVPLPLPPPPPAPSPAVAPSAVAASDVPDAPATGTLPPTSLDLDDDAAAVRVEELSRIFQADPTRDDVVDELAALLMRLGRGLELFALLAARIEEASPERRAELLPQQKQVLALLEADSRAAGREQEASLFRDALAALE